MIPAKIRIDPAERLGVRWLALGGTAALLAGMIFLLGVVGLITASPLTGSETGIVGFFRQNWLVKLFELNAGLRGAQPDPLSGFNGLDAAILALVGLAFVGLSPTLRRSGKIWVALGVGMPFLGIVVFLATGMAGRSAVMGAGLVISFLMLRSHHFTRMTAYLGLLSNALVLASDIGSAVSLSFLIAVLLVPGYIMLTGWFLILGWRLFRLARPAS